MIVTARREPLAFKKHGAGPASHHGSKPDGAARGAHSRGKSKEEFVILSAVERALDGGAGHDGYAIHFRRDTGSHAYTVQIERQAIAQIDAGSGAAAQGFSESQARVDGAVPRLAEAAGDVENIAGMRSVANASSPR